MAIEHTDKAFAQELAIFGERLTRMGGRAADQITRAMRALDEQNDGLAREVIAGDAAIDADENDIDHLAMRILATRQPVATDLRFLTVGLRFIVDVERIGDLAVGIAKRALELNRQPVLERPGDLGVLATLVQKNLRLALDSFVNRNADEARMVIKRDAEIDRLNASLFAQLLAHVASDAATVTRVLPLTSVCRYLERIGDHVKNLAEEVIFLVQAMDIRHQELTSSN
jgi:phosphate transport system protein